MESNYQGTKIRSSKVRDMRTMPLIYSYIIPFKDFYAMNLFGYLVRRRKYYGEPVGLTVQNHEGIHTCQVEDFIPNKEGKTWKQILGYIIFYLFYFIEWIIKGGISLCTGFKVKAYYSISFEQEAHINDTDYSYQGKRKRWAWYKYLFKLVWKER